MTRSIIRKLIVAAAFAATSLRPFPSLHLVLHPNDDNDYPDYTRPEHGYVRPPGNKKELWEIFEDMSAPSFLSSLPSTPNDIARRYGLPKTPRNGISCDREDNGTTTIGWIPSAINTSSSGTSMNITYQGKIPRLIFQSWKTNKFTAGRFCAQVKEWSILNPEYDYFLFDDGAIDRFILVEYGREIFSSFNCVKIGAARCDIWRLMVIFLFGGVYFDVDVKLLVPLAQWDWGDRDVVTSWSCTTAPRKYPAGCPIQWGLIFSPQHLVIEASIIETLENLANRNARHVYDVSFWSFYHAWWNSPYNQSYMPGWSDYMGNRVLFQDDMAKIEMVSQNGYWQKEKLIWRVECIQHSHDLDVNLFADMP